MAETWVKKVQYYYDIYKHAGEAHYDFTDADVQGWRPGEAFNSLLGVLQGRYLKRARGLLSDVPKRR